MSIDVTFANSVGVYLSAAADAGNSFIQSATTFIGPPATWVGNLQVVHSTANSSSKVFVSADLYDDYPWTQYNTPGQPITYYVTPPLSG